MLSSSSEESSGQSSQSSSSSDSSSFETPTQRSTVRASLVSQARNSGIAKKTLSSKASLNALCRSKLPKPRRVPNVYEQRREFSKDDPPSIRPEGYRSPYSITKELDRIQIWWEGDDKFYYATVRNPRGDGKRRVEYDDGQVIYHLLSREVFTLVGTALERFLAQCFPDDAQRHTNSEEPVHYPGLADFLEVGYRVQIYCDEKKEWYPGVIRAKAGYGLFQIIYDDEDREVLKMQNETFRFIEEAATIVHTRLLEKNSENKLR